MKLERRQLLKALGLGALSTFVLGGRRGSVLANEPKAPSRVVFFVTPHGHLPNAWTMQLPGSDPAAYAELALGGLEPSALSPVLRPLHAFRDKLLVVEGLSHASVLHDIAEVSRTGGDLNNHSIGVAGLLTGERALQRQGQPCTGGMRSIDQELGLRSLAPGRYASRVYGYDYVPNSTNAPFSFLGAGKTAPYVSDPKVAFADLMSYYTPDQTGEGTREQRIRMQRGSVLDTVADEYAALSPRLSASDKRKLDDHRQLIRELEAGLGRGPSARCDPTLAPTSSDITQFMRLTKVALACDLTRVVTFVAPVPQCPELGYPGDATFHGYAHQSIEGATSCGTPFSPVAAKAILDLGVYYAGHFATLLTELDSVPEGDGTLLDHTAVVWVTELATPTHLHNDAFHVVAGSCGGFFRTGRYVRYPRPWKSPIRNFANIGPGHNRLHVSLLQAMGQSDTSFGLKVAIGSDGSEIPLVGPLTELHRSG